jgi:hypothetical protein
VDCRQIPWGKPWGAPRFPMAACSS